MQKQKTKALALETTVGFTFQFHIEGNEAVIDKCDGISPEAGMAMFPDWCLNAMKGSIK